MYSMQPFSSRVMYQHPHLHLIVALSLSTHSECELNCVPWWKVHITVIPVNLEIQGDSDYISHKLQGFSCCITNYVV